MDHCLKTQFINEKIYRSRNTSVSRPNSSQRFLRQISSIRLTGSIWYYFLSNFAESQFRIVVPAVLIECLDFAYNLFTFVELLYLLTEYYFISTSITLFLFYFSFSSYTTSLRNKLKFFKQNHQCFNI